MSDYLLMLRNKPILRFNTESRAVVKLSHKIPYTIANCPTDFDAVLRFCNNRILSYSRAHSKEILDACRIGDQTPLQICIICKGLSLMDHYWIKRVGSYDTWESVNLFDNEFSTQVAHVALTGQEIVVDENFVTGELTCLGTRAKCCMRSKGNIVLVKKLTREESLIEALSKDIADVLELPAVRYNAVFQNADSYTTCNLFTDDKHQLIPARHYMLLYSENTTGFETQTYKKFFTIDYVNFFKMQIFDILTMNSDRNRDNYGILTGDEDILAPIYDHDSCFKAKSLDAHYFVCGLTFRESADYLFNLDKAMFTHCVALARPKLVELKPKFETFRLLSQYEALLESMSFLESFLE